MKDNQQDSNPFEELVVSINALTEQSNELDLFLWFVTLNKKELESELIYYKNYECYKCCKVILECINKFN